jgi:CheY-like chemotaxis protein
MDAHIRTIMGRIFTTQGYRVSEAADGYTAFTLARQLTPALIVLDLGLPGQDGWAVARELRADPACEHIPLWRSPPTDRVPHSLRPAQRAVTTLFASPSRWKPWRKRSAHC